MDKQLLFQQSAESMQAVDIPMATTVVAQPMPSLQATPRPLLGPKSSIVTCPFCLNSIRTAVKFTTTSRTFIAAALCAHVCCCCCIPFCCDSAKNTDHYCPSCLKYLGTYEK